MKLICVFLILMISFSSVSARIYEKRNADGTVTYSDSDASGGRPADLPPIGVSDNNSPSSTASQPDVITSATDIVSANQYQSLRILGSSEPLDNLVNNPNMQGVTVVAELMPGLNPNDQVDLMYNGKILMRASIHGSELNLGALYSDSQREDNLINRLPPKGSASITQEKDKSLITFKVNNLNRVNFPPGLHTWQVRVLDLQGKVQIESNPRQFNVHYSELIPYKPTPVRFVGRMKLLLKIAATVARAMYSPI